MGEFRMPSLGADMEHGTVADWLVSPGTAVHRGDVVAVITTDKSDIDAEVFEDGVIEEILVPTGTEVPVGTVLARIGDGTSAPPTPDDVTVADPPSATPPRQGADDHHGRVHSPIVRALAREHGVDLTELEGSGPGGRITRSDVLAATRAPHHEEPIPPSPDAPGPRPRPAGADGRLRITPLARRRARELALDHSTLAAGAGDRVIRAADVAARRPPAAPSANGSVTPAAPLPSRHAVARLMERSNREIPHYYLASTVVLRSALDWLELQNVDRAPADRILPAALLLKATALAARATPALNGWWREGALEAAPGVDLGVVVALRGGGLAAPTIASADGMAVDELMSRLRDVVNRARSGRLRSSDLVPATTSVTNLGDQGVEEVFGVIHPPQVAIIGFGRIDDRPVAVAGEVQVQPTVRATVAADHRASDGHQGAKLLQRIDRLLQTPEDL
jgi:pyruvate dehydrogenase E2 component (dihydrolipoamide acetyltransferase)